MNQQSKSTNKNDGNENEPDTDFDPIPVKPKPFKPSTSQTVSEEKSRQWGNPKPLELYIAKTSVKTNPLSSPTKQPVKVASKLSRKDYLELNHTDKPKIAKPSPVNTSNVDLPSYAPYQVLALLNGDTATAMRLYEGEAKRNHDKSEQWLWSKVESDLERDRR